MIFDKFNYENVHNININNILNVVHNMHLCSITNDATNKFTYLHECQGFSLTFLEHPCES